MRAIGGGISEGTAFGSGPETNRTRREGKGDVQDS